MFASTRRWFLRNRTPLAISVGVFGSGYVITQYLVSKFNNARECMSNDRVAKENLRRRFEQNQEDCTFTVLALLPTATTHILDAMNTEKITYEIQQMKGSTAITRSTGSLSPPGTSVVATTDDDGRSIVSTSESGVYASQIAVPAPGASEGAGVAPQEAVQVEMEVRKTKRQLWDDLTISSITRAYTLIYILGLLTMLTRVQLNLLGRRSYLSSVISLATGGAEATISLENNDDNSHEVAFGIDFDVNRKYLAFSWWLLNRGWVDVNQRVEGAVRSIFGHLSPRDTLTFERFSELTRDVRDRIEGSHGSETRWLPFLLPHADMENLVLRESGILDVEASPPTSAAASTISATSLRRLLDETADLAESPAFAQVLSRVLDAGFAELLDRRVRQGSFEASSVVAAHGDTFDVQVLPASRAVLLPKILSVLTRQAHAIGNGMPNEYLQVIEGVRDLEAFAAVVYSSNWEAEIVRDEDGGGMVGSAADPRPPNTTAAASVETGRGESLALGDSSIVMLESQGSLESAWERAVETQDT